MFDLSRSLAATADLLCLKKQPAEVVELKVSAFSQNGDADGSQLCFIALLIDSVSEMENAKSTMQLFLETAMQH